MFNSSQILAEYSRLNERQIHTPQAQFQRQLRMIASANKAPVDILTYVTADFGIQESPYPAQRLILKLIYGLPLDDRPDDTIIEVLGHRSFKVSRISQFFQEFHLDIGKERAVRIKSIDYDEAIIHLEDRIPLSTGMGVTRRIMTWDRFKENCTGSYTEREFLQYLYDEGPEADHGRCNISPEMHDKRIGRSMTKVVLRLGRRAGKTSLSQWIAAHTAYRILKHNSPQEYYRLRREQPISITLVSTAQDQAIDLLSSARSAMTKSPWLRQFIRSDSGQKMALTTQHALDKGDKNAPGIVLAAAPCSARTIRGKGNILVLLEEYGCFFTELQGSNKSDREVYKAISPSTADFVNPNTRDPEGMILIISTPMTKESHMNEVENSIWNGESAHGLVVHLPSYWVSPMLTTEKLKDDYMSSGPLAFQQEFEAMYLDEISSVFTKQDIETCRIDVDPMLMAIRPDERCYLGLDVGIKGDGTGIVVVAGNHLGECRVIHHENIRVDLPECHGYIDPSDRDRLDIRLLANRVDDLWTQFACVGGLADAYQSYGIQAYLTSSARQGILFQEVNQSINDRLARNFIATVFQKRLSIAVDEKAWDERESILKELLRLQQFQSKGSMPKIKLSAPRNYHDDTYSALSRAVWLVQESMAGQSPSIISEPFMDEMRKRSDSQRQRLEVLRRQSTGPRSVPGRYQTKPRRPGF